MKRIKDEEIIVMKTDKSGKMSVTSRDKYKELGKLHVGVDEEVDRAQVRRIDKLMNNHSVAWVGKWRMGQNHEHQDRIVSSKTNNSENRVKLYLAHKDHKKEAEKTMPIGTWNTSNTRAFANCVSELLESVDNSKENPSEVISSEGEEEEMLVLRDMEEKMQQRDLP